MKNISFTILFLLSFTAKSQHVIYSDPEKISFTTRSEVIGKVGDNIFVCDLLKNKYQLKVFDKDLKVKQKIDLNFIPAATYRLNFINYADHCLVIFQSVESKKRIHTNIASLDKDGQLIGNILPVDSISAGTYGDNEFYTVSYSENKEHLLFSRRVIGIKPDKIQVDQVILNNKLEVEKNENYFISYERGQLMSDLNIDDNGNIVFMTYPPAIEEDQSIKFYKLPFNSGDLMIKDILIKDNELSEPQIKINNKKNLYYLTSLYQDKNTKAVAGLLSIILNYDLTDYNTPLAYAFLNPKKPNGKTQRQKNLFDNYFIRDIIFREDGGFVIAGTTIKSDGVTTSNPKLISMNDIYATKNNISNGPTRRGGVTYPTQNIAINYSFDPNNITAYNPSVNPAPRDNYYGNSNPVSNTNDVYDVMIISVDKNNHVINTAKVNDSIPLEVRHFGFQKMNLGSEVYILFNNAMKYNTFLLNSVNVKSNGNIERNPLFRNLDRGYTFLVESGKQLDMSTMIVPCEKNNKKAFAMIRFD